MTPDRNAEVLLKMIDALHEDVFSTSPVCNTLERLAVLAVRVVTEAPPPRPS